MQISSWRNFVLILGLFVAASASAQDSVFAFPLLSEPRSVPAVTFVDAQGARHELADSRGGYVLLNLWATWCAPCRLELPALFRLQDAMKDAPFKVIALSTDTGRLPAVQRLYREIGLKEADILIEDPGPAMGILRAYALPTTLLIDPDGNEIGRIVGAAEWDSDAGLAFFRDVVAASK